ncbi:MAG: AsnC family transcriptional regulator [Candidatus Thorarchaeota archaeon]|jgi:DNA-binding Lrp family transcriptional regulator
MDNVDQKIVDLLAINCRLSLQELAVKTEISAYEVKKRIDTFVQKDVIHNFTTILSPHVTNEELSIAILDFEISPSERDLHRILSTIPSVWRIHRSLDEKYVLFCVYFDEDEFANLKTKLRTLEGIREVEMHSRFLKYWGGNIPLTDQHKQILRCLFKDARMSIADIAMATGLESKTVAESVNRLRESETVLFTISASDYMTEGKTEVLAKIQWNVGKTSQEQVSQWLQDSFHSIYLREYVSVTEPTLFFDFTVNHVQEVDAVTKKVGESGIISTFTPLILFPGTSFDDPRLRKANQLLEETGFSSHKSPFG